MRYILFFGLMTLVLSCKDGQTPPKPHAYPRIYFPEKSYQAFDTNAPYSFIYPEYAEVRPYNEEDSFSHPFWYNVNFFPSDNGGNAMATLHMSYHEFRDRAQFDKLFDDTRRLAYKHDIKAEEIEQIEVHNPKINTTGIIYEMKGNTATNLNFYISDGQKHFLRGALYFNSRTEIDSILPMYQFLKQDVIRLIETTKWKP
jgi:gliding motility-associated lipoprotein GldD